jgi:hypothetical protein
MKEDFDKILTMAVHTKDVNYFGKCVKTIQDTYGVSEKTVYNRFKSCYGCSPRDYITSEVQPSREEVSSAILNSSDTHEVKKTLGLSNRLFSGIYDTNFGVSTFSAAKEKLLMSVPSKVRVHPFREDNVSILMSQHLGDGCYCNKRHALRVVHGVKQGEYLKWKVALIFEGYNKVSTKVTQHTHKQGHEYYAWYSGKLGNVDFPENKVDAVKLLTPIGWLLLYLDDGCYGQDMFITTESKALAVAMQDELKTYGITSRVNRQGQTNSFNVYMCGGQQTIGFYKNFIEPFIGIIPKCMEYKTKVKI